MNGILQSGGQPEIQPCEYQFPVATFLDAIALAATFTDVVLGTLPEARTLHFPFQSKLSFFFFASAICLLSHMRYYSGSDVLKCSFSNPSFRRPVIPIAQVLLHLHDRQR